MKVSEEPYRDQGNYINEQSNGILPIGPMGRNTVVMRCVLESIAVIVIVVVAETVAAVIVTGWDFAKSVTIDIFRDIGLSPRTTASPIRPRVTLDSGMSGPNPP